MKRHINTIKSHLSLLSLLGLLLTTSGCNNEKTKDNNTDDVEKIESVSEQSESLEEISKNAEITLLSDDRMKFDKKEIRVKDGQSIKLTLKHTGTMPKTAMGHNFVLLKQRINLSDFGSACGQAKAPDYDIPADLQQDVIAYTKMIGGGESITVEFEAPAKGTYDFLCSFPGHFGIMKGKFIVE